MPRVKFSTLITAMAGKSGGSVFSKNRGGYYFRNNKFGYKLKTSEQQLQQGRFKAVARQWSQLNDFQRQAWRDAVTNYPVKDIFGDDRPRTGYDLFCQINGALQLRNVSLLDEPLVPEPVPTVVNNSWLSSESFLYQPVNGLSTNFESAPAGSLTGVLNFPLSPVLFKVGFSFMFCFHIDNLDVFKNSSSGSISFDFQDVSGDNFYTIEFIRSSGTAVLVQVSGTSNTWDYQYTGVFDVSNISNVNTVFINYNNALPNKINMTVNGFAPGSESFSTSGTPADFYVVYFSVSLNRSPNLYNFTLFDVRLFNKVLSNLERSAIQKGYQVGNEVFILQFPIGSSPVTRVFGSVDEIGDLVINLDAVQTDPAPFIRRLPILRVPSIVLSTEFSAGPNWLFELLCSPPTSEGRGVSSLPFSPINLDGLELSVVNDITNNIQKVFPYWTEGNDFQMMYRFFNSSTGQVTTPQQVGKPKKGIKRFKAGAELSGKVNK